MPIKVAIVEDDKRVREGLAMMIDGTTDFRCIGSYPNAERALEQMPAQWPEVVLMDINLPNMSGIDCVARIKEARPALHIIMLTVYMDEEQIFRSLKSGASGYLLKKTQPAKILEAIADVSSGGAPMSNAIARKVVQHFQEIGSGGEVESLTDREREILNQLVKGFRNKEIADLIGASLDTVRTHLRNIYHKLHVNSRTGAVAKYFAK